MTTNRTINFASVQKIRIQLALAEERDASLDGAIARKEANALGQRAIDERRAADRETAKEEKWAQGFAIVSAASSMGSGAGTAGTLVSGAADLAEGVYGFVRKDAVSPHMRRAESYELLRKQAEQRGTEADADRSESAERTRRSMDTLLAMQRDLTPKLG